MVITQKSINPPTSGSALLQFFTAAFRQEDMDSSSDEDEIERSRNRNTARPPHQPSEQRPQHDLAIRTDDLQHNDTHSRHDAEGKTHARYGGENQGTASGFSFGTVHDKDAVAEKLQSAFGYSKDEVLIGEYSCWMARSVLLPGYMYLTTNHVCFYANLPSSLDVVQKEGFFSKKSKNTKTFSRFWFILKNDVLSYYADQTDIYYPIKTIDLKEALSAEPSDHNELAFYVYTRTRRYKFKTDSELARTDWVKAIQKSIFHAKMNEDNVKISIPLANVLAVEMNSTSFAETIRLTINDRDGTEDDFYFAYFDDTPKTLAALQSQLQQYQAEVGKDGHRTNTNLRFFNSTSPMSDDGSRKSLATEPPQGPLASSVSGIQQDASQSAVSGVSRLNPLKYLRPTEAASGSTGGQRIAPPSPRASVEIGRVNEDEDGTTQTSSTCTIRGTAARTVGHTAELAATTATTLNTNNVELEDNSPEETFRKEFSLPEGEALFETYSGYLLRVLPLYGKIYLSDNYICFKSTVYKSSTRVIVPLADVDQVDKHHGTRFYFHGLAVMTKMGDEIFFEFSGSDARSTVMKALQERITPEAQERRKQFRAQAIRETPSLELDDPMESRVLDSLNMKEETLGEPMSLASHPGFKPSRPLHITCLTIGSRGDVQPYIALCKRLMEDGHSCRIATHGEYKDWIEGHGIEFGHVGGDPGELIELCVENGMFTVSFIREGLKKFRGWLDDLMQTAWEACQNTDVLIESPSAMAGIHIAEALAIPYFRAFPFPWTRTRAFPHPFAVPERNLGRGYNYMTYAMIEQVFWKGISGQVNRWRRKTLGIDPTSLEKMEAHRVPSLYSWSPSLLPAPMDWHSWVHVTGYWFLDNPDLDWKPPKGLEEFLEADPKNKPVYIGFGSMVVSDPESMTKTIVDAVVKSGVRAIVSKGWSDKLSTQEDGPMKVIQNVDGEENVYPSSVYMLKSVPHDWLFHRLSGVVHHGGAGTTAAGLRTGVPTVIKPYFGDQYFWAQRIEDAGVGVWCHDLTVKKLSAALTAITTDEKMIKKAHAIGEKIRAEDGVGTAIQYFYHDLAIAKQHQERHKDTDHNQPGDTGSLKDPAVTDGEGANSRWLSTLSARQLDSEGSITKSTESESTRDPMESNRDGLSSTAATIATADTNRAESAPDLSDSVLMEEDDLERNALNRESLTDHLKSSATEPGPDRTMEMINGNDKSAEGLAAELEAMRPPHDFRPQLIYRTEAAAADRRMDRRTDEQSQSHSQDEAQNNDHGHGQGSDSEGSSGSDTSGQSFEDNKDKLVKKKSKARRVFGSIASKARKVKAHFRPCNDTEKTETIVVPLDEEHHSDAQR